MKPKAATGPEKGGTLNQEGIQGYGIFIGNFFCACVSGHEKKYFYFEEDFKEGQPLIL